MFTKPFFTFLSRLSYEPTSPNNLISFLIHNKKKNTEDQKRVARACVVFR